MLSNDIMDYYIVSQGKTTIPNVDDGEECLLTDVSRASLLGFKPTWFKSNPNPQREKTL